MIYKFSFSNLRNAEYNQYMKSVHDIFVRLNADRGAFGSLIDLLDAQLKIAETAMSAERRSEKVREKNDMDRYRDRLHSKLFNHLKTILYDEYDARFDDAQAVMKVVKEAGNPTQLSENRQTAMMTLLGNRLEPLRDKLQSIGALEIVDEMLEANRQFIILEEQARDVIATHKLENAPSAGSVRKEAENVYRNIVDAINAFAKMPHKKEKYKEVTNDTNVIVERYNQMIAARKRSSK